MMEVTDRGRFCDARVFLPTDLKRQGGAYSWRVSASQL